MKHHYSFFLTCLVAIFIFAANLSPAQASSFIPKSEAALGGIQIGATADYVRSIYGEPTTARSLDGHWCGYTSEWVYGETFKIDFENGTVTHVEVSANNGITTPAGFAVGQNISAPLAYYGDDTCERLKRNYLFYASVGNWLNFTTDKKGNITNIVLSPCVSIVVSDT